MNIQSVSKKNEEAVIRLSSSELVILCNVLHAATKDKDARADVYRMYSNLMIARELSQYGAIDEFCLERIVKCRERYKELKHIEG